MEKLTRMGQSVTSPEVWRRWATGLAIVLVGTAGEYTIDTIGDFGFSADAAVVVAGAIMLGVNFLRNLFREYTDRI
jgi:hypothetical protein